jgi:hypothetical protein
MMTKIKYAFSFLFGMLYLWSLSYSILVFGDPSIVKPPPTLILTMIIVVFGGAWILFSVIKFFVEYWDNE